MYCNMKPTLNSQSTHIMAIALQDVILDILPCHTDVGRLIIGKALGFSDKDVKSVASMIRTRPQTDSFHSKSFDYALLGVANISWFWHNDAVSTLHIHNSDFTRLVANAYGLQIGVFYRSIKVNDSNILEKVNPLDMIDLDPVRLFAIALFKELGCNI